MHLVLWDLVGRWNRFLVRRKRLHLMAWSAFGADQSMGCTSHEWQHSAKRCNTQRKAAAGSADSSTDMAEDMGTRGCGSEGGHH